MIGFFLNLLVTALSLLVVDIIFPGVTITSFVVALLAGVAIGLVNAFIKPVISLLSLPLTILTLGLFSLVVNGLCFWLAAVFVPGFSVHGPLSFILAPIVLAFASTALNKYFSEKGIGSSPVMAGGKEPVIEGRE